MKVGEVGRFWFDDSCSPEEISAVRPLIEKYQAMLPAWLDSVKVSFQTHDPDEPSCTASIHVEPEYRRAKLTLFALWLSEIPEHREEAIVHELCHCYTHAQRIFTKDVIILAEGDNATLGDYLREQERKINEATTEDFMLLLRRLGYLRAS